MTQKETLPHLVKYLKENGTSPTKEISKYFQSFPGDSVYNFRWGQQQLKKKGIIGIDKSVNPAVWYLIKK